MSVFFSGLIPVGDIAMKWQVLMAVVSVSLLIAAPVSATVLDFSTDPNLTNDWTRYDYYGASGAECTAEWNASNRRLDLHSASADVNVGLYKKGTSRSDLDSVTLTLSNIYENRQAADWLSAGLLVSQQRAPGVFDNTSWYSISYGHDSSGMYYGVTKSSSTGLASIGRASLESTPASVKFDITRDGSNYVFLANGTEICRDSSMSSTSLPYYMMYWGSSSTALLSLSADNFGVVPEPGTCVMMLSACIGLICYAWRKRK